jgi:putative sporulation protein YyaC
MNPGFFRALPNILPQHDLRVNTEDHNAVQQMASFLSETLNDLDPAGTRPIILLGIGTDRSTGDSLGPLVGSRIHELAPDLLPIYGTLDEPVHAVNLKEKLGEIDILFPGPLVIAVDACLGQIQNVGSISMGRGALHPGTGVHKELPAVGDIYISGVVNIGGFLEYLVLQNTRLGLVMKMSERIARAVILGYQRQPMPCSTTTVRP